MSEGLMTQPEELSRIKLSGKEPILRFVELHVMVKIHLLDMHDAGDIIFSDISEKAPAFNDFRYRKLVSVLRVDLVAGNKSNAGQGRIISGIQSSIARSNEEDGDTVSLQGEYDPQPEFGFRFTDPSLTGYEGRQTKLLLQLSLKDYRL